MRFREEVHDMCSTRRLRRVEIDALLADGERLRSKSRQSRARCPVSRPLNFIAMVTQIMGNIMMTPLLISLVLMTSDKALMRAHRTGLFGRTWSWSMAAVLVGFTLFTLWHTLSGFF